MSNLHINGVTKRFKDGSSEITAVDNIDLKVDDGEFLVLVGPSGCGKSTTLRMIAGLESINEGSLLLNGETINSKEPRNRDIAMVFQSYALYPHMTVRGNMSFGLRQSTDLDEDVIRERVESTANMMGIGELLDRKPGELSGGQQQRVALGRAIVRDPSVFLMDEPLSNLDAKLRSKMRTEVQRIQDDLDVTTIYVTHDQTEAMTMGDRIAILDSGELQQVATPLEAYHRPANQFVAGFLGEPAMNFFDVTLQGDKLVNDGFEYTLSEDILDKVAGTEDLTLGVRPEDIELVSEIQDNHDFAVEVDVVEPTGDENHLYLSFQDETINGETFVATVDGTQAIRSGQTSVARFPEEVIHLFDRQSGVSLHNRHLEDTESINSVL